MLRVCAFISGGDCTSSPDRLVVRDGVDTHSSVVLRLLCGTRNGETMTSSGEALSVQLLTDAARQRQGFAATFSFVDAASVTPSTGSEVLRPTLATSITVTDAGWSPHTGDSRQINVPGLQHRD